jgi:hypothetical protein
MGLLGLGVLCLTELRCSFNTFRGRRALFKYFRFDEWSIRNLRDNTLYLNHHSFFNDPFECRCEIRTGFPKLGDGSSRFADVLRAWGFERADDEVALENYDEYMISLEGTEPDIEYYIDSARITCFSRRPDNLLMWAHYGDGLRGFCIEFDEGQILASQENANLYEVLYAESPSVVDASVMAVLHDQWYYNNDAFFETEALSKCLGNDKSFELSLYESGIKDAHDQIQELYQKMLATKPIAWSYEEELRLIDCSQREDSLGITLPYPVSAIKSVVFGEKISRDHEQAIVEIVSQMSASIELKRAVRVTGSFDVHIAAF